MKTMTGLAGPCVSIACPYAENISGNSGQAWAFSDVLACCFV